MANNALGEAVRQGKEVATGETAVTASVAISTPFQTIHSVSVTQKIATAPGLASSVYTYDITANVVTIYAWKPTSVSNPTLIAGTVSSDISYTIVGKRR